jgi:peptidoglycan/xylan/chitin deacetylase (PgdA/CDA1 family)
MGMLERLKLKAEAFLRLSTGERIGCGALVLALLLSPLDLRLALVPPALFVVLCFAEAFRPASSFYLPVISRGKPGRRAVSLTFDDGPHPQTTPELLRLLERHRAPAAFFVNGRQAARYPGLAAAILAEGHAIANHSFSHDMLGAFRRAKTLTAEIEATQAALRAVGVEACAYRPPMGITGPRLAPVMRAKGMFVVNFSCRARDGGNRWIENLSGRILMRIRAGDIVLLHDLPPVPPARLPYWLSEIDLLLKGVRDKGLEVLPLAELIGREVMVKADRLKAEG